MIKSMTGYGRAQQLADGMNITVEIKSVNHRYFEFSSKLPRSYGFLDEKLKKSIDENAKKREIDAAKTNYLDLLTKEAEKATKVNQQNHQ